MEVWKTVNAAPEYSVSSLGRLKSQYTNRPLVGGRDKDGYRRVVLCTDGRRVSARIATLVCEAFHGPRPAGGVVRHLDGSRSNDSAANLAWGTQKQNIADKVGHGTSQRGERHPRAKLTREAVVDIRSSDASAKLMAERYGVTTGAIFAVRSGRLWAHV